MKFDVEGMTCGHCAGAVRDAIHVLDPQAVVEIDVASGAVDVASAKPRGDLAAAIRDAGYATA